MQSGQNAGRGARPQGATLEPPPPRLPEQGCLKDSSDHGLRPTAAPRKSSKPLVEKRRRARINASLAQLKHLVLEALKIQRPKHSKLDKADILELTERRLQTLQHSTAPVHPDDPEFNMFQCGFKECIKEMSVFLSSHNAFHPGIGHALLDYLASCTTVLDSPSAASPGTARLQDHMPAGDTIAATRRQSTYSPLESIALASSVNMITTPDYVPIYYHPLFHIRSPTISFTEQDTKHPTTDTIMDNKSIHPQASSSPSGGFAMFVPTRGTPLPLSYSNRNAHQTLSGENSMLYASAICKPKFPSGCTEVFSAECLWRPW
ncbi:transcription factor HES-1-like [Ambystoma mexicanum]|uniref:transcription factor HES-1-like n=1 Tax=Ambystoma mexicanum TaxID=8296 RepID=UPI0037E71849